LADYLTRQGMLKGDLEKLCLKNIAIKDFSDQLPKQDFTLKEWAKFCEENPQYLTVNNSLTVMQITKAISRGIENIKDVVTPLDILKRKFSREIIIKEQKLQFTEIYTRCLGSKNFFYTQVDEKGKETNFMLVLDLLMIENEGFKVYVPDKLIGTLLAYTHLLGHLGTGKMMKNLQSYYFKNMYTRVKSFASRCYSCFLMHSSSRKNLLGTYPVPEFPMEEICLDLAENLNSSKGYQHLLIVQCPLTDFVLLFPLKSKTANEVNRMIQYGVLQHYNVKKLHMDNAPCFRNPEFLAILAELKIEVINTSVRNPAARGKIESEVKLIKNIMKKILATSTSKTLNWENIPHMVATLMNHVKSPKTGFAPATMLYGTGPMSKSFIETEELVPKHHSIRNNISSIEKISKEITRITEMAREMIIFEREQMNESRNANKIDKEFRPNDFVFVLDRSYVQGAPRPLRTKYSPSPFVVVKSYYTTVLCQRIADNFRTLISKNDVKKYKGGDPEFSELPREIQKILVNDFKDLIQEDLDKILELDPLEFPPGIEFSETKKKNNVRNKNNVENEQEESSDSDEENTSENEKMRQNEYENEIVKKMKREIEKINKENKGKRKSENIENTTLHKTAGSGRKGKRRQKNFMQKKIKAMTAKMTPISEVPELLLPSSNEHSETSNEHPEPRHEQSETSNEHQEPSNETDYLNNISLYPNNESLPSLDSNEDRDRDMTEIDSQKLNEQDIISQEQEGENGEDVLILRSGKKIRK
jgi:hypothetical protein